MGDAEEYAIPPEMVDGYFDGRRGEPEPGANRSHSYRHGWKAGHFDKLNGKGAWSPEEARELAQQAIRADVALEASPLPTKKDE